MTGWTELLVLAFFAFVAYKIARVVMKVVNALTGENK